MAAERDYEIRLDDKYGSLRLIDLAAEIAAHEPWFNQTLTTVNDAVVRLGGIEGGFHWDRHAGQDEFFLVVEGRLRSTSTGATRSRSSRSRGSQCRAGWSIERGPRCGPRS